MTETYLFTEEKETRRHTKKTHDDQRAAGKGGMLGANGHETGKEGKQLGHVQLFATPWAAACQDPPSIEFSRQEYWSGLPFPTPGDLSNPGIKPTPPVSPASTSRFFTTSATWEVQVQHRGWLLLLLLLSHFSCVRLCVTP